MQLHIFNATKDELASKKHSIFIGISVCIKPMSHEIAVEYLEWAKNHSDEIVHILLADEIAKYNYLAFGHHSKQNALMRALRDGDKYQQLFEKAIASFPKHEQKRFKIIRWEAIVSEQFYKIRKELTHLFETNEVFKNEILAYLDMFIKRRGRTLSYEKKLLLSNYILDELPVLLDGIHFDNKNYTVLFYPTYKESGMSQMVSDIQHKRKFAELSDRLNLKKTIMVESII